MDYHVCVDVTGYPGTIISFIAFTLVPLRKRQSLRNFEILNPYLQSVNSGLKFQKASDISYTGAGLILTFFFGGTTISTIMITGRYNFV
jgi:hypothetical protein